MHAILEHHTDGEPFPPTRFGLWAAKAWPYVPNVVRENKDKRESELNWSSHGVDWTGKLDFTYLDGDLIVIGDYKTVGRAENIKSPEELASDVPAILYSDAALTLHPQARHVLGLWVYVNTGNHTSSVSAFFWPDCREMITAKVERDLAPYAREMIAYHEQLGGSVSLPVVNASIPKNLSACGGMGIRCDYATECDRSQ